MINKIFVLEQEYHLLEQKLGEGEQIKQEIAELGKEANLQWSETFWHDNPILESKQEIAKLFSMQMSKYQEIERQLASCLILTEEEILKRKKDEITSSWKILLGVWSIVNLQIEWAPKVNEFLVTGVTQGIKIKFMGREYTTLCSNSPIWQAIAGKSIWESSTFFHWWKSKEVVILSIK